MGLATKATVFTAKMVKKLYEGKKYAGTKHSDVVRDLSTKHPDIAKGLNIAGQKFNKGFNYTAAKIKRYPKISSAVAGGVLFDLFTRDYEDEQY